jgi:hypothetical protein
LRRCLVTIVIAAACAPGVAHADGPVVGLVVFRAPAVGSEGIDAARDLAIAAARDAKLAWLDLTHEAPVEPAAAADLRAGIDAYEELRWDDALSSLDSAADAVWASGGAGLATAELSDVFLYRGLVHTQRGDTTKAWDDLVRAAAFAPARTLDPARFPTRAVEAFARARDAVTALPRAAIEVSAPGCEITIDGGEAERATLPHGEHVVRAVCPGRAAWGERVVLAGDVALAPPAPDAPPDDAALAAIAKERAVAALIAVIVADDGATASVRVVGADGSVSQQRAVALDAVGGALADTLATESPLPPPPPRRARWWKSPWLWAAGGVAITTAVLLPFALSGGGSSDVGLRPVGWTW